MVQPGDTTYSGCRPRVLPFCVQAWDAPSPWDRLGILLIQGAGLGCYLFRVQAWGATSSGCRPGILPLQGAGLGCYLLRMHAWDATSSVCRPGILHIQGTCLECHLHIFRVQALVQASGATFVCAGLLCSLFMVHAWDSTYAGCRPGVLPLQGAGLGSYHFRVQA